MKKYLIFFFILFFNLNAQSSINQEIISHLKKINSLEFKFIQKIDNNNIEKGECIILYPKKILCKYVPMEFINRPKQGFCMPTGPWIRGPLNDWAKDMLSYKSINEQGYLNPKAVENILKRHNEGIEDNSSRLWNILMWQSWLNEWY